MLQITGIRKETRQSIRNGTYGREELFKLAETIQLERKKSKKECAVRIAVFMAVVGILMLVSIRDSHDVKLMLAFLAAFLVINFVYMKFLVVDRAKNQFVRELRAGYPELCDEIASEFFGE